MQGPSPCPLGPLLGVFEWKIGKTHRPGVFLGYPLKSSKSPSAQLSYIHSPWLGAPCDLAKCCVTPSVSQHCCVYAVGLAQTFGHPWTKPSPLVPSLQMVSRGTPRGRSRNAGQDFAPPSRAEDVWVCLQL